MDTTARRAVAPTHREREEQPGLEGLRSFLRVLIGLSIAATVLLAVFPVFGTLGLLSALVAALAYVGLMIVTRVERRRYLGRHGTRPAGGEVGFRVIAGGEAAPGVDRGDATVHAEGRQGEAPAARAGGPPVPAPAEPEWAGSDEVFSRAQWAGAKVLTAIGGIILVLAVVVAAAIFDWPLVPIGLFLALACMALFGLPVWLASAEDAAEAEKQGRVQPR